MKQERLDQLLKENLKLQAEVTTLQRKLTTERYEKYNFAIRGSNYLFRSDPLRFREKFKQRVWGSAVSPPLGVWGQNAMQMQENSVQFILFWSKI